jgi:hypothetical protein
MSWNISIRIIYLEALKVSLEELGHTRAFQLTCRGISLITLDTGPVFGILKQSGGDLQAKLTENEFYQSYVISPLEV